MIDLLYQIFLDPFVQMGTAPDLLVQTLWEGLVAGVLYALIALGYVLIYKASGVFNFAQGAMVLTAALALVRALDAKKIAGAALDTTDPEPLPNPHPLRGRENVIINPHVAWYSEQAMVGLQAGAPNEVRRVLSGEWPVNVVNKAVKGKSRAGL